MAARKPCSPGSFFGKGFPRAIGKLGDENQLLKTDNSPQLPNAPLLQWAGKADWNAGGAAPKRIGKQPKPPINPEDAYVLYLQSRVKLPAAGEQGSDIAEDDILALKHDAAVEALNSWAMLSDNEKKIFEDIAREDRVRFQEEAVHYEVRNPGWFGAWLKRQSAPDAPGGAAQRAAGGRRAGRPRPPLTPWTAFVQATLDTLKKSHPEAAAGVKHVELMRMAMKEAAPIYKSLSADEKARYIKIAEEDKERYEKEVEAMPAWKRAKLGHKGTKTAKKGRSTKRAKRAAAKEGQADADEEEEVVDTTGLNPMQAWAAKQRAARRRAERKPAAPSRRTRKAAQHEKTAEEEVDGQEAAELAALPDEAYIRTRATGDSDDSSDGDDDVSDDDDEDDEDGADSAHGDMSDIVETQINDTQLDEPTTQGTEDGGVLSRVRTAIKTGLGWLTTTKRRGLLSSMQDVPMTQEDGDAEDEGDNAGLDGQWVGRPVLKKFGRVQRPGTVKSFNRRTRMYQVDFEGSIKETLLVSAVKTILQPLPSTAGLRGGRAPTPRKLEALYNKDEALAAGPKRRKRAN